MLESFAFFPTSVSELNTLTKALPEDHFTGLWIAGEVPDLARAASGHHYFSLKDSRIQVRCAMFKGVAAHLTKPLEEGDHTGVAGKISIYGARGEFQIMVNEVWLKGLEQLYEAYERLRTQSQVESTFTMERKKPLLAQSRCIDTVTGLAVAALRGVVTTLKRRVLGIPVIVYPTAVQSTDSESQIARAIKTTLQRAGYDVLIACRSGGSTGDLWAPNEELVVRATETCTVSVAGDTGYETDFTLVDFIADMRTPTPTGAAELVSPDRQESLYCLVQTKDLPLIYVSEPTRHS